MSTAKRKIDKLRRSIFIRIKSVAQQLRVRAEEQKLLFIVGCQRSGTTLLSRIFERDWRAKSYGEGSGLSYMDSTRKLRLRPLDVVSEILAKDRAPLIVMKPLVESQRTIELLDHFPNAKAVWLYREFRDVAASNITKFGSGNGVDDIRPIVQLVDGNWRSETVSPRTRDILTQHYSEDMNPYDAAVLFWFARNALFFELNLNEDDRVALCRYEDLAQSPALVIRQMYRFVGRPFPGDQVVSSAHGRSVNKGRRLTISPRVEETATELLQSLDAARTIRID